MNHQIPSHKVLEPLQGVLDSAAEKRELEKEKDQEILDAKALTREELAELKDELKELKEKHDSEIMVEYKKALGKTQELLEEYAAVIGNPDETQVDTHEHHLTGMLELAMKAAGVEGKTIEKTLYELGLKEVEGTSEFFNLDTDDTILDLDEFQPAVTDESLDSPDISTSVKSVFEEYGTEAELKAASTPEALEVFLVAKWKSLSHELAKLNVKSEKKDGGKGLLNMFSKGDKEKSSDTSLDNFFDALQYRDEYQDKDFFERDYAGNINFSAANEKVMLRIKDVVKEATPAMIKKVKALNSATPIKEETREGKEILSDLMENGVPEDFRDTQYALSYKKYAAEMLEKGKMVKDFDDWSSEVRVKGKPFDWKYMLMGSGLFKMIRGFLGDTFLGKFFQKDEVELSEDEVEDFKQSNYKSRLAYKLNKRSKEMVDVEELLTDSLWENVSIEGFETKALRENKVGSDFDVAQQNSLKDILNAPEGSALAVARTLGLSFGSLESLSGIKSAECTADKSSFTVNNETKEYAFTADGIAAATEVAGSSALERQVGGSEKADLFDMDSLPPEAFTSKNHVEKNLQPALKSLLNISSDYWATDFLITEARLKNFLLVMEKGKFKNKDNTFSVVNDKDEYYTMEGDDLIEKPKNKKDRKFLIEVRGSGKWDNYRFEDTEALFKWIETKK